MISMSYFLAGGLRVIGPEEGVGWGTEMQKKSVEEGRSIRAVGERARVSSKGGGLCSRRGGAGGSCECAWVRSGCAEGVRVWEGGIILIELEPGAGGTGWVYLVCPFHANPPC